MNNPDKPSLSTSEDRSNSYQLDDQKYQVSITPSEERKNRDSKVAANLALSLWIILGCVIGVHLISITVLNIFSDKPKEEIELKTSNINDTAKTIYSFLTALATGVSGYYFGTVNRSNNSEDE